MHVIRDTSSVDKFALEKFAQMPLREAVKLWCDDQADALQLYGDINDGNGSRGNDMSSLFWRTQFNDGIDR
jgi:hypothetical protein